MNTALRSEPKDMQGLKKGTIPSHRVTMTLQNILRLMSVPSGKTVQFVQHYSW